MVVQRMQVYQFIGEDNIYFMGLRRWGLYGDTRHKPPILHQKEPSAPNIVANRHLLFSKARLRAVARSSLRWRLNFWLLIQQNIRHTSLLDWVIEISEHRQKPLIPTKRARSRSCSQRRKTPINVFNRSVRSCFYTIQRHCEGRIPVREVQKRFVYQERITWLRTRDVQPSVSSGLQRSGYAHML